MQVRYRYRLYPHPPRQAALARAFGCAPVVWNDALALSQDLYKRGENYLGSTELQKRCITQARQAPERSWLAEVSNVPLLQSVRDLDQAFPAWWSCRKGKRQGRVPAPRFKRRSNKQSLRFTRNAFRVEGETLRLTKVGSIPITWSRDLPATPSSVTIIKDGAGRHFASFVVQVERPQLESNGKAVGIDLGGAALTVTSDGEKIAPPQFLRSAGKRLRRVQRSLRRKARGADNRFKARFRLAKAQAKVSDSRLDVLHKLSTRLIRETQAICIEDMHGAGMMQNRKQARSMADAGWRMLRTLLEYNADLYGPALKGISRWQPASQAGSTCGHSDGKKPFRVRAAWNILAAGLAERLDACGAEGLTGVSPSGREAGTHLNQGVQLCTA